MHRHVFKLVTSSVFFFEGIDLCVIIEMLLSRYSKIFFFSSKSKQSKMVNLYSKSKTKIKMIISINQLGKTTAGRTVPTHSPKPIRKPLPR